MGYKIVKRFPLNSMITTAIIWLLPLTSYLLRKLVDPNSIKREYIYFYTIPIFLIIWLGIIFKIVQKK